MSDASNRITVPRSFLEMPRWWNTGREWLDELPETVAQLCVNWHLTIDGDVMHGSNAIAIPVEQGGEKLILRATVPDAAFRHELASLRFWDGRGTAKLHDANEDAGAMLLERLDVSGTLEDVALDDASLILGHMVRRLSVPAPEAATSTVDIARTRLGEFEAQWVRLGHPFERALLDRVMSRSIPLTETASTTAVNGDLHWGQVLRGIREPWLAVDPNLLRGDAAFDPARSLWMRIDEMTDDEMVRRCFRTIVEAAELDPERALMWAHFRTVDYWLWALDAGLTIDPERCRRLATALDA